MILNTVTLENSMSKPICVCVRNRIFGEGQRAAMIELRESDCKYGGEKREIWLEGYRSLEDESED